MKLKIVEFVSLFSCIGILIWMTSYFYGGLFIWLISYWYIILPLCLIYFISLINLIIRLVRFGYNSNKINFYFHSTIILCIVLLNLSTSELFKSKIILSSTLKDDLFSYQLKLRENGNCDLYSYGFMGFEKTYFGKYKIINDTIIFSKIPYDKPNFIPNKILIDQKQKAIFIEKNSDGMFNKEKNYMNYFEFDNINKLID